MSVNKTQNTKNADSSGKLKRVFRIIVWSGFPEQEQAALRIVIPLTVLGYLLSNKPVIEKSLQVWSLGIQFVLTFLVCALILYSSTIIWAKPSSLRRTIGIFVDIIGQSYALYITGAIGAPWYGLYLWVILGNGFRYGENYLYLSTAVSLIGFACVVRFTPYWTTNMGLAIGLAFTLLLIPAYSALLIRRLNEARQRADAASRTKSDFLSCMSHEIRTPLNGILGMTDLLRLRPLESEDRECVETIHASGQALARQINDILDLSKIEAGELSLEQVDFDLHALINTTLRIFHPQAESKQLQLQGNLDPGTPYQLSGDPHKLRQVIINLVGNAIKFTDQGFISVRVHPREFSEDKVYLRFEVADTGIGIPPERQKAIFEPFTQADSSVSRSYGGTGLGMTICKNMVELMGGEIGIQSTPGVGTTFWFDIPFKVDQRYTRGNNQAWAGECKVLYLHPDNESQNSITTELRTWHIPFDTAATIKQASDLLQKRLSSSDAYDALVIEALPYSNEMENLLSSVKTGLLPGTTSVILIHAGHYPPEVTDHDRLYSLKAPVDKRILFNTLHACYSRRSTEDDIINIDQHQARGQQTAGPLNILVADDNATNRIVLQRMLEKLGHHCTVVTGGEEALEELEQNPYDAIVIDKNMPDMGGVETYQAYCLAHGGHPPVRFIILTADATEESRTTCKAAGIEFFMTKPVSLARLQETLAATQITGEVNDKVSVSSRNRPQTDTEVLPVIDETEFGNIISLAGKNKNFINEIIRNFETDANNDLRGLEASVANHDWTAFRDYAHALKGSALYLGLAQLAQLSMNAEQIEQDDFDRNGISHVLEIQKTAKMAISELHEKESLLMETG